MVILTVEIDDLHLFAVDPEREQSVRGDGQTPSAPAITGQPMHPPGRHGVQFFLPFHVLKKGDNAPKLRCDRGLHTSGMIVLDEPAIPL